MSSQKRSDPLSRLMEAVRAYCAENAPGETPTELMVRLASGRRIAHPVPPAELLPKPPAFVPSPFQRAVLAALDGSAMHADDLGHAVGDRRRLFKPGGVGELREQGLVDLHDRLGYFRPDSPPPELAVDQP